MWTPGYWAWDANNNDYYWVPGTWVLAPYSGALWTPGYWAYNNGQYAWSGGYWGMHIGYYGGINYGYGYTGAGYQGGYWNNGAFRYNRSVNNVGNAHVANAYSSKVNVVQKSRVSFNGGNQGVQMTSSKSDQIITGMPHQHATPPQVQHENDSRSQPNQRYAVNHGAPKVAATPQPSSFQSERVEPARAEPTEVAQPRRAQPQQTHQKTRPAAKPVAHAEPAKAEERR